MSNYAHKTTFCYFFPNFPGETNDLKLFIPFVTFFAFSGWAVFVGIGVLVFQVPLNAMLARMQKGYREKNLHFKDGRVKLFGEILNAVKVHLIDIQ